MKYTNKPLSPKYHTLVGLFTLSAASLAYEIDLTRLFSVAQFYHFAFMIVSIALLGYGASGSFLAIFPRIGRQDPSRSLAWLALATSLSILGSYLLTNLLPFDSFSIALDKRQAGILVLHYLSLASPFFFCGLAVGLLLEAYPQSAGRTYAANLSGSAFGCAIALVSPTWLGGEGTVVLSSALSGLAAIISLIPRFLNNNYLRSKRHVPNLVIVVLALGLLGLAGYDLALRTSVGTGLPALELYLSPYKGLSYALQYPGARVISRRWNATSRIDVVRSDGIRSLPGLSYRYMKEPPTQDGVLIDADELSPMILPGSDMGFASYLPLAAVFQLRPKATALVLEPHAGLDVVAALELGARDVTAVEANPLIVQAATSIYSDPRITLIQETGRSYFRHHSNLFDVILLSLTSPYHPVRSGAYSLGEDYRYTVEAFEEAINQLEPGGLLTATRWLQNPPSEELRLFALAVTAIEHLGGDPRQQIIALRGYNTGTLIIKKGTFTERELQIVRRFASERAFDLVFAPGLRLEESNQFNILPEPIYYQAFNSLLETKSRQLFYSSYPYDITPPTDDRPFFNHFFKWSQVRQVMAELGKTWQPFGGAGYLVVLALLVLALIFAVILILLPVVIAHRRAKRKPPVGMVRPPFSNLVAYLLYFGLLGLAFLFIEIPLVQGFILYLGQPAYAMAAVIFTLLLFSGLGSRFSNRISLDVALPVLALLLISLLVLQPAIFRATLGLQLPIRTMLTVILLAPVGFLMGVPFPVGIQRMAAQRNEPELISLAWAVNGSASVISAVLAALLALSLGFHLVLSLGALCYVGAWLSAQAWQSEDRRHLDP